MMNIAVIFAGGVGTRMRSKEKPKQFLTMHDKPIIIHTLEKFENHPRINKIVIACVSDWIPYLENLIMRYGLEKVYKVVPGGKSSQESIYHGLCAAEEATQGEKSVVLIHDGVRPLINETLISANINSVVKYGSAITSIAAKETVVEVSDFGNVVNIPNRNSLRIDRAPQSFWLNEIIDAHRRAIKEGKEDFVDSCSLMRYYGKNLHLIEGPQENIKITTPDDFYIMRAIIDAKENAQIYGIEE